MATQKLIDYVKRQAAAGYNAKEIKQALLKTGYSSEIADEALEGAGMKQGIFSNKTFPFLLLGLAVLAGFGGFLYFTDFTTTPETLEEQSGIVSSEEVSSQEMISSGCIDEEEYVEDFETGWASEWYLGEGFEIVDDESNEGSKKVLQAGDASSSIATYLFGDYWTDLSFGFDMKLDSGKFRASIRSTFDGEEDFVYDRVLGKANERYYVDFTSSNVVLGKTEAGIDKTLDSASYSFDSDEWYTVKILAVGDELSVSIDDTVVLSTTDSDSISSGSIDFATEANADVLLDNINVAAQVPCFSTWVETEASPYGGDINVIAVDPQDSAVVFAGTEHAGLWKSTDGGLTWEEVGYSGGVTRLGKTMAIGIAPSDDSIVYNAGKNEVDKSTDGGIHWTRTGLLKMQVVIRSLAVDPSNPDIVYVALGENVKALPSQPKLGIFKSTDGGENWEQLDFDRFTFALAIPSSTPTVIYAGAFDGVYKSTDSGERWTKVYTLQTDSTEGISSVAVDPADANTIYAASADGILKSTDAGENWNIIKTGGANKVVISEGILYTFAGDIVKSADGGKTWSGTTHAITSKPYMHYTFAVDPSNSDKIYAGTWGQGIFFSEDSGKTWQEPDVWEVHADLGTAIVVDPSDDNTIYTGTSKGEVYGSDDKGETWTLLANLGSGQLYKSLITAMVIDPSNTDIIYASNLEGVYKSEDKGKNWEQVNDGLTDTRIISLALDPEDPNRIFAGTGSSKPRNIFDGTGMFFSANGGESWSQVQGLPDAPIPAITISPVDSDIMYATVMDVGVYKSEDGGESWSQINTGLKNFCVYALAIDPEDPDVAYVGTLAGSGYCKTLSHKAGDDNVYKTENGGKSWEISLPGENILDTVEAIAINPTNSNNVYVTYHTEKVWFSSDAGDTWRLADDGVIRHGAHLYLWAVTFDSSGSTAYIATCGEGVLKNALKNTESVEELEERHREH